jgi:hypothetical protein
MKVTMGAPLCAMCPRDARWLVKYQAYARYCGGEARCINRERSCKNCGHLFAVNEGGAGTRYCSLECKRQGYTQGFRKIDPEHYQCAWCGVITTHRNAGHKAWPYICAACLQPIKHVLQRLHQHHVTPGQARQLVIDPSCPLCGVEMLTPVRRSNGHLSPLLTVDHDHNCCPGTFSCGHCIRGLICNNCNLTLGLMRDDITNLQAMVRYLQQAQQLRNAG